MRIGLNNCRKMTKSLIPCYLSFTPLLSQVQQELMVVQRAGIGSKTLGDVINTYQSQPDI